MKTLRVRGEGLELDFETAKRLADAMAGELLGENVCMAWLDRLRNRESPAHCNSCHSFEEYAESRGAELKIETEGGEFAFCYRPLGEFSPAD